MTCRRSKRPPRRSPTGWATARRWSSSVPERLNPGGAYEVSEIPLVVGADADPAREAATALYDSIVSEVHQVEATETAELTKVLENTYRMVNIALVNELVDLAERTDADLWAAIQAAATKPFGFQPFYPGPGVGGHCIPVDPQFLTWRADEVGTDLSLVERASEINDRTPGRVADRVEATLSSNGVPVAEASVLVLGAAYKPDVGDRRNAPSRPICERLADGGADVEIVDPHVETVEVGQTEYRPADGIDQQVVREADAVLVLVDHTAFDYGSLDGADLVFDAVNAVPADLTPTVVNLGDELPSTADDGRRRPTASNVD
ncbi:hypothetical protein BRC81_11775 [Halobacteriales archaeon QS_1_68_20]|nr:MAG: hypothetical protein BRC81_11775 [Halobacteriales archaeon QS_1_68_20]